MHDLGLVSIATWSKRAVNASPGKREHRVQGRRPDDTDPQLALPVVSVGMGGKWRGTIEASMSKGRPKGVHGVKLRGRAMFPAWAVPMASLPVYLGTHVPPYLFGPELD